MERRTPLLAGFVSLIGARRLKPPSGDDLLLNDLGTDNLLQGSVHPACVAKGVTPGRDCPCEQFYDDLVQICIDNIDKHAPESSDRWNCSDIVYKVWHNKDEYNDLVYKLFLAPNRNTNISSIPVFWAGYSWTLGTRQTMDAILRNASDESVIFRDIEHADTPIGQALRARNWDRPCHASKYDSTLWIALSKIFAHAAQQIAKNTTRWTLNAKDDTVKTMTSRGSWIGWGIVVAAGQLSIPLVGAVGLLISQSEYIGKSVGSGIGYLVGNEAAKPALASMLSVVLILINYEVHKLEKDSFLVQHELENLHAFESIVVMDFKNHCSPSLVQMILSGARSEGQGKQPVVSCVSSDQVAFRHDKEQFSTMGDYRNMVHHINHGQFSSPESYGLHGRQTRVLDTVKNFSSFVETAGTAISRLEACYTEGIVWRTSLQAMPTSEMTGNRDKDIMECQKLCNETRSCSHFNVFTSNRTCQLLHRTEELYYETASMDVVSGRPNCTKSVEDEERAASEQKIREKKDLKAMVRIVDVTRFVDTAAFTESKYQCCCDKRKTEGGEKDDERGINSETRANYCVISDAWTCGSVKVRYDTIKAHNYKSTGGNCEILRDDVPALVKIFKASDYCPKNEYPFMGMEVAIPAAAYNETRSAPCLDGSVGIVTCQIGTPTVGYWGPVQCSATQPSWCPAIPKVDDAAPEVAAAKHGTESLVLWEPGESSTVKLKCTEKGWIPDTGYTGVNEDVFSPVRTVDVTHFVKTDAFTNSGYQCCCDKRKTGFVAFVLGTRDDRRGINHKRRANYCVIRATSKCGDVKVRDDTKKAHNYKSTGGTCEILRDDVPALVKTFNTAADYCPKNKYLFMDMEVDIPAAAFNEKRSAPCSDGSVGNVICQIGTPTFGFWGRVQCAEKPTWCPAIPKVDDAVPEVAAAQTGTESPVLCEPGESSTDNTKCTEKGWIPERGYTGWKKDGFPPVCFPA